MEEYRVKCGILWASALKLAGQPEAALVVLERLRGSTSGSPQLLGWVLSEIGDNYGICGNHERGIEALEKAAYFLRKEKQLTGLSQVNSMIGTILRSRGRLPEALQLFTMSISDYERLGMTTSAAYIRLLVAETHLAMDHPGDAEREILKALPVLETEEIGPESLVAFSILREAVRRRKLEPKMLRELRERLRPGSQ
jgi:tetratricopeptide (TPR) repeat protein